MALELEDLIKKLDARVRDPRLGDDDKEAAIESALNQISRDRPRRVVEDIQGSGSRLYSLPGEWKDGFSVIHELQYPVDVANNRYPTLDRSEYQTIRTPEGDRLLFVGRAPGTSETFRLHYTLPWTVETLEDSLVDPVADLAAAFACETMASYYAGTSDPTINADAVDYRSKSGEWLRLATTYRERYTGALGSERTSHGGYDDLDLDFLWGGDFLTHPRAWRS